MPAAHRYIYVCIDEGPTGRAEMHGKAPTSELSRQQFCIHMAMVARTALEVLNASKPNKLTMKKVRELLSGHDQQKLWTDVTDPRRG